MVQWWAWFPVMAVILGMLAVDLLLHKEARETSTREAAVWSAIWITLGLGFGGIIWFWLGGQAAGEYLAGYLIEKSLSVDNIFVFAVLFVYFAVPSAYQHRVLFWGVMGALVFRAIFIALGAALISAFHWMIYVFGIFLVITGVRMSTRTEAEVNPAHNPVLRLVRRFVPMTPEYRGHSFFVREGDLRLATPLLAVVVVVETTDILFALDSIPAIFSVTRDPFLVFTSNAFAILGLRALYFLLAGMIGRFVYLRFGLALVLVFVGMRMLLSDIVHLHIWVSLLIIAAMIAGSVFVSLRWPPDQEELAEELPELGEALIELCEDDDEDGPGDERPRRPSEPS